MSTLRQRCRALLNELGISMPDDDRAMLVEPLGGGVASDIAMLDLGDRRLCVKFALPKLKVAEEWHAPVHRNRAEYEWLRVAAKLCPDSAVQLYGRSEKLHGFAMEYLRGDDVYLWKTALLQEQAWQGEAARVGHLLGRIHAASVAPDFDATLFQNGGDFQALRIEPYITFTAQAWPQLASELTGIAAGLKTAAQVLVHGDISPKNIMFKQDRPIILDAECATMGDAGFDSAFCLNHLILKAVHLPRSRAALLDAALEFWRSYAAHVSWEPPRALETRVCRLIPALMLARIDGKSPVEYLNDSEREAVRALAVPLIKAPPATLDALTSRLAAKLYKGTQ